MKFETYLDHATILANEARPVHFAVRLRAESITQPRPVPAAFCVVLDRSGSMQGEPLARAREAAALAVRNLRSEDQLALVVFDDAAQTILPLQRVCDRTAVLSRIHRIEPGGSTNLTAGWMLGRDALRDIACHAAHDRVGDIVDAQGVVVLPDQRFSRACLKLHVPMGSPIALDRLKVIVE